MQSIVRHSAHRAALGLVATALAVGGTDPASAEPIIGFETPQLVQDFETVALGERFDEPPVVVGDHVYLLQQTEFDPPASTVLWEYDVVAQTIREVDISAFPQIGDLGVAYAGTLVFGAERDDGASSIENVVASLEPGGAPRVVKDPIGFPDHFAADRDGVYFAVDGSALWFTNLTDVGTVELFSGADGLRGLAPAVLGDETDVVYAEADPSERVVDERAGVARRGGERDRREGQCGGGPP